MIQIGAEVLSQDYNYELRILCPFHDDHSPSCDVNLGQGVFHCHSCQTSGNMKRLSEQLQLSIMDTYFLLLGMNEEDTFIRPVKKKKSAEEDLKDAFDFYTQQYAPNWDLYSSHYLLERGYTPKTLHTMGIRLNNMSSHPIVIPITEENRFVGYVTRRIDAQKEGKYHFNPGFPRKSVLEGELYPGIVLVVEGMLDKAMVIQHGWKNTTAILSSCMTEEQAEKLARIATRVICGLDNPKIDEAGRMGLERLEELMSRYHIQVDPFPYPEEATKDQGDIKDPIVFADGMLRAIYA